MNSYDVFSRGQKRLGTERIFALRRTGDPMGGMRGNSNIREPDYKGANESVPGFEDRAALLAINAFAIAC
ncbi:MAG: hypothetical protein LBT59_13350 [Clostridiales bacterium]|jgi:hypothetical protein|nr:hypothetical protein [Clostridiales bacterium]